MEFESFNEGTLLYIGIQEGNAAPVDRLAIIGPKERTSLVLLIIIRLKVQTNLQSKKKLKQCQKKKKKK
jgi:hypothetical protein